MDGYSISQVAVRTGFAPSTLRFYEQSGLVRPARTPAGYRSYDDSHVELLAFIGRAKGFGLSLEEITELLGLLDAEECAPVQGRLRDLVDAKINDARAKVAELQAFTAELERVAASLNANTPDGPCDNTCGCTTDQPVQPLGDPVVFRSSRAQTDAPAIACTLSPDLMGDRLADWQALLGEATGSHPVSGGRRVHFARGLDIGRLAALVAAEQDCCRFFTFVIAVGASGATLDVVGPPDALPVIDALVETVS
jgi:MerR family copper efflux transcriptional regulator